jgi:hypothetical protein
VKPGDLVRFKPSWMDAHNSEWSRPYLLIGKRKVDDWHAHPDNVYWVLEHPTGRIVIDEFHYEIEVVSS